MNTNTFNELVAYRVSKGFDEASSIELLREETRQLSGDNLAAALVYQSFATEMQAIRVAEAERLRSEARRKEREAHESFERCDTDGALSQWASEITSRKLHLQADIAEAGGIWQFPALFDLSGNVVPAKLINGKYGLCWMVFDKDGEFTGEFVSAFPKRRQTIVNKGYLEGYVMRPAYVRIGGQMASSTVYAEPKGEVTDEPVEIVTTDRWAWEGE